MYINLSDTNSNLNHATKLMFPRIFYSIMETLSIHMKGNDFNALFCSIIGGIK